MPWLSITMTVTAAEVEALSDALVAAGALAVDVTDANAGTVSEQALFDEPNQRPQREWALTKIGVLVAADTDVPAFVSTSATAAGLKSPSRTGYARRNSSFNPFASRSACGWCPHGTLLPIQPRSILS